MYNFFQTKCTFFLRFFRVSVVADFGVFKPLKIMLFSCIFFAKKFAYARIFFVPLHCELKAIC